MPQRRTALAHSCLRGQCDAGLVWIISSTDQEPQDPSIHVRSISEPVLGCTAELYAHTHTPPYFKALSDVTITGPGAED